MAEPRGVLDLFASEETPVVPLILARVDTACADVEQFISEYCQYFEGEMLFLPYSDLHPAGRRLRFAFTLADGREIICGEGLVLCSRRDTLNPAGVFGMELRYGALDEGSQWIIDRMLSRARQLGGTPALPPPPYVSLVARRERAHDTAEIRAARAPHDGGVVPANPFGDVPERALEYFIEWSLEHVTTRAQSAPQATSFAEVVMALPRTVERPRRGARALAAFAVGLAAGAALLALMRVKRAEAPLAEAPAAEPRVEPPAPPPAEVRQNAAAPVEPSVLSIATLPPGAQVLVDGRGAGTAPLTLAVAPGPHEVRLERPRYAPVRVMADAPGQLSIQLQRPAARLRVTSLPPGAAVRVDGRAAGATPLELSVAAYESYRVDVELGGRLSRRSLYLKPPLGAVEVDFRK